jgi:type II secretory pathway component PulM
MTWRARLWPWGRRHRPGPPEGARRQRLAAPLAAVGVALAAVAIVYPAWKQIAHSPARQARWLEAIASVDSDARALAQLRALPDAPAAQLDPAALSAELQARSRRWLGASARVAPTSEGWEVTFDAATPDGLADWLTDVRQTLALRLVRAQWERDATGWRGTAVWQTTGGAR